jgi:RNA polymerase II subunit A small phosphatase-like protein
MTLKKNRNLLLWDIDETLWHADYDLENADFCVLENIWAKLRPSANEVLRWSFRQPGMDVGFWTAGTSDYAEAFCKKMLLPEENPALLFARNRCTLVRSLETFTEEYVKDLKKVRRMGYDLDRVLMVDNSPRVLVRNYGNLVPIPSFYGNPEDRILQKLPQFLEEWFNGPVRTIDKRGWWTR